MFSPFHNPFFFFQGDMRASGVQSRHRNIFSKSAQSSEQFRNVNLGSCYLDGQPLRANESIIAFPFAGKFFFFFFFFFFPSFFLFSCSRASRIDCCGQKRCSRHFRFCWSDCAQFCHQWPRHKSFFQPNRHCFRGWIDWPVRCSKRGHSRRRAAFFALHLFRARKTSLGRLFSSFCEWAAGINFR